MNAPDTITCLMIALKAAAERTFPGAHITVRQFVTAPDVLEIGVRDGDKVTRFSYSFDSANPTLPDDGGWERFAEAVS